MEILLGANAFDNQPNGMGAVLVQAGQERAMDNAIVLPLAIK
ncbi:hypothetical protein [Pedobacter sp. Hv1]|nr:hypothetical protein [Pedobacter sp. Hv1]